MSETPLAFGPQLRTLRQAAGLTRAEVVEAMAAQGSPITSWTLDNWEANPPRRTPALCHLPKLAKVLRLDRDAHFDLYLLAATADGASNKRRTGPGSANSSAAA